VGVTVVVGRKKPEADLCPAITTLFQNKGFNVWEEATIRAGDEGTRTADHVAWRWKRDEILACAVEVKAGKADVGLAQAVAYGVGFDRIYVAAEDHLAATGYLAKVFDRLGIGYVWASPTNAKIELEATPNDFISIAVRDENIGRIRLKHLWNEGVVGEPTKFGKDRRGPIWGVTGSPREWQICVLLYPHSTHAYLSLVAESRGLGERVASRVAPEELSLLIEELGISDIELHLRRREYKFQPRYQDEGTWQPSRGVSALADLLASAQALVGHSVGPWFEIRTNLWSHAERLTESEARKELRAAVQRLRPVRDTLNRVVGR
jgi:hypothetical protein